MIDDKLNVWLMEVSHMTRCVGHVISADLAGEPLP